MPPTPKKKNKNKLKKSEANKKASKKCNLGVCMVRDCNNKAVAIWSTPDGYGGQSDPHKICSGCLKSHHDHNHQFSLQEEFNYEKLEVDRFGFTLVKDEKACLAYLAKYKKKKNSKSIERLREWKKKNEGGEGKSSSSNKKKKKKYKKFSPRVVDEYRKKISKKKKSATITTTKKKSKKKKNKAKLPTLKTKKVSNADMDDIFDDILG